LVRVTGGEAPGGSSLAPKIGPLGLVNITEFLFIINTNKIFFFV
jgi:ribosomal protein L11